jgi:glycosyltransferase involved in cell wall biosynthesis
MAHELLPSLKVALVHDSLTVPAGAEKVLFELHQMFPNAPIYTPLYRPEKFPEYKDATVITSSLNRWSYARNHHQVMIPLLPYYMEQFDLSEYDIVISDSSAVAKGVITRPDTLHICYCHTPMRWAWMPFVDRRASSSFLRRIVSHYLRIWDAASTPRVDAWLANSQTVADRIWKFYHRTAQVLFPPVTITNTEPSTESGDYFLTVGRLIPGGYKRTDLIIQAAQKANVKLKIAGDGPLLPSLKRLAGKDPNIEFLGRVSNEVRDELYRNCKAFVFAAEEDFGIVPIEAMSYGKPVIAYGRGGASETVIDKKTGLHFHEPTADSLALAMNALDEVEFDPAFIAHHAQQFSAQRFRNEMFETVTRLYEKWKSNRSALS